jgi:hypothetical protein
MNHLEICLIFLFGRCNIILVVYTLNVYEKHCEIHQRKCRDVDERR